MYKSLILSICLLALGCGQPAIRYDDIFAAIQAGDLKDVKAHLRRGTPIETNRDGFTPYLYAASLGNSKAMQLLADRGANVRAWAGIQSSISLANLSGDTSALGLALDHQQPVSTDQLGIQLQVALARSDSTSFDYLLRRGANPYACSETSPLNVLQEALAKMNYKTDNRWAVRRLLRAGMNADSCAHGSLPPLALLLKELYPDTLIMDGLIANGAKVNHASSEGVTPLMVAAERCFSSAAWNRLKQLGADPLARDKTGRTALHYSCLWPSSTPHQFVLDLGVDVNAQDNDGVTALHLALVNPYEPRVLDLLAAGADPRIVTHNKLNPLEYASRYSDMAWTSTSLKCEKLVRRALAHS